MPGARPIASGAIGHFDLALSQYREKKWLEAARSCDKAIILGSRDPKVHETKAKCHLKESVEEAKRYADAREKTGPTGDDQLQTAYKTAENAIKRSDGKRWQPYYIIADILYHQRQYFAAQKWLTALSNHQAFQKATPEQKAMVRNSVERVAHDRRYLRQRIAGRAEGEAMEEDIEREAQVRKRTSYEHLLTADIFLRIVDLARDSDPRLATRMSGVCQRWRGILVNQPGVWQRLILGKGPYLKLKVQTHIQRCSGVQGGEIGAGRLKELKMTEGIDTTRANEIMSSLQPHAPHITRLDIQSPGATAIIRALRGRMSRLRSLRIARPLNAPHLNLTNEDIFAILPVDCSSLQEIDLQGVAFNGSRDDATTTSRIWLDNPSVQLSYLTSIRLDKCTFTQGVHDLTGLLRYTPLIKEVHISSVTTPSTYIPQHSSDRQGDVEILEMEHLETLSVVGCERNIFGKDALPFDAISTPNLKHLDLEDTLWKPSAVCRSEGLRAALAKLQSLSLAKCAIPDDIIDILREMKDLHFLNLSRCSLTPSFLEALANGGLSNPPLLPNLVALSLAGNLELRVPVLRDIVNSRLNETDQILSSTQIVAKTIPQKLSLFKPKRPTPPPKATQPIPVPVPTMSSQSTRPARLRWLNIDLCENVDPGLLRRLETRLGFVSHWLGAPEEDRIRGQGRWDWKMDINAGCRRRLIIKGEEGKEEIPKCEVRPNGNGKYYVHHICAPPPKEDEEKGFENISQTQRDQLSAGQAKMRKRSAGDAGRSAGRRSG